MSYEDFYANHLANAYRDVRFTYALFKAYLASGESIAYSVIWNDPNCNQRLLCLRELDRDMRLDLRCG